MESIGLFHGAFRQVAWITNDLDRALASFALDYGVPRWLELRDYKLQTGLGTHANAHFALAVRGGLELELIQPLGGDDHIYRQVLTADPALQIQFHHVCYRMESASDLAALRQAAEAKGRVIALHGETATGTAYFYIDDRPTLGHHVEYIYYPPDDLQQLAASIPAS